MLFVDDNSDYANGVRDNLALYGIDALTAGSASEAWETANIQKPDVVFIDIKLGKDDGVELLERLCPRLPGTSIIMITGYGTIDTAIKSLKLGAKDYLQKPVRFEQILQKISEDGVVRDSADARTKLVRTAVSEAMSALIERAEKLASTGLPILIVGEHGTGKELVADFIAERSNHNSPYVKVNSSAFSESLLENELFGHEKGAYTGATSLFRGVFERADGGTLFLDEIGDMPKPIQAKILRALQNKEVRRLGGEETIFVDARFVAATNKDLPAMIEAGDFREDLYYRLNAAQLLVPPLRDRVEDIEPIAHLVLEEAAGTSQQPRKRLSAEVREFFIAYRWPGNVRELRNSLLYAAAISGNQPEITVSDLPGNMTQRDSTSEMLPNLEESERETILRALKATDFNKSHAASLLSISRSTLYEKIRKYGIAADG